MSTHSDPIAALDRAAAIAGGLAALAAAINVAASTPSMWKARRKVPAEYCPAIEKFTRDAGSTILCEELRPDVPWGDIRTQAAGAVEQQQAVP